MCQVIILHIICQPSLFMGSHRQLTYRKASLEPKITFPYQSEEGAFVCRDLKKWKCEQRRGKVSSLKGGTHKAAGCLMAVESAVACTFHHMKD